MRTNAFANARSFRRPLAAVAAATIAAIALTACSSGGSGQSGQSGSAAAEGSDGASLATTGDTALADLQKDGVLKIASEGTYAPFTYHDDATGKLTGYDVDVITAVAEKLGVKPDFTELKWDGIFAGLEAKRYDVIANEVSYNEERAAKYDLTDAYSVSKPAVLVKADNNSIKTLADVKGKTSTQSPSSNWFKLAQDSGTTVLPSAGFTEEVAAVKDGRVDVVFNDDLAIADYLKSTGDKSVKVAFTLDDQALNQVFVLRKDSGLVPAVNKALADLKADGTLAKLGEKYFGRDISK